jgi:hypothetical protein
MVHAIKAENVELAKYFLERGAYINVGDQQWGWTPMHYTASESAEWYPSRPRPHDKGLPLSPFPSGRRREHGHPQDAA